MRIDAHQHFWRYEPRDCGWIGEPLAALRRDFLPADAAPLLAACGLDGCVAVQARASLAESDRLLALAAAHPFVRGVVGWVDLCDPAVADVLARLAAHPRFCGVRHLVQDEPDDSFLLREDFLRGARRLAAFDLAYDVLVYPRQLPAAIAFADRVPELRLVLDHLGKPPLRAGAGDGALDSWAAGLRELGRREHVACKLSGLVTEADWRAWRPAQLVPCLDLALEIFGPARLLFGSDWPVCTLAGAYEAVFALVDDWSAALAPAERAALFGGNAARCYGLVDMEAEE